MCAVASGGTPGYDFNWSNGSTSSGIANDSITSLCPGNYTVTVTDANGCSRKSIRTVGPVVSFRGNKADLQQLRNGAEFSGDEELASFKASAIPNPFTNDFIIETGNSESVQVRVFTLTGKLVKDYLSIYPGERVGGELSSGLYLIEITQNGNSVFQRLAKQNQ